MGSSDLIILMLTKKDNFSAVPQYAKKMTSLREYLAAPCRWEEMCGAIAFKTGLSWGQPCTVLKGNGLCWQLQPSQAALFSRPGLAGRYSRGKHYTLPLASSSYTASLPLFFFLIVSKSDFKGDQAKEELDHLAPFTQRNILSILFFVVGLKQSGYGIKPHYSVY